MTTARPAPAHRWTPRLAAGAFAAMVLCATSTVTLPTDSAPARAATAAPAQQRFDWTPAQVAQLIAAIEDARDHGLDPQDYGLAALRGERDLCVSLYATAGSTQLDALARAAAVALAADYRKGADRAALAQGIEQARRAGQLRSWLAMQARS